MQWAEKNSMMLEDDYPYTGEDGSCAQVKSKGKVTVKTVKNVQANSSAQLLAAITLVPTTVAVEADTDFQFYSGGILNNPDCGDNLDHAILAVGFDQKGGYYIVRNSWGTDWGEDGYIRMAIKSGEGICGIQMEPAWSTAN